MIVIKTTQQEILFYTGLISLSLFGTLSPIWTRNLSGLFVFPMLIPLSIVFLSRKQLAERIFNSGKIDRNLVTDDIIEDVKKLTEEEFDSRTDFLEDRIQKLYNEIEDLKLEISDSETKIENYKILKKETMKLFDLNEPEIDIKENQVEGELEETKPKIE